MDIQQYTNKVNIKGGNEEKEKTQLGIYHVIAPVKQEQEQELEKDQEHEQKKDYEQ